MFVSCLENKQAAAASFTMYRGIFNEHSTRRIDFDSRPTHKRTLRPPTAPKSTLNIRNVDTFRPPAARAPFNYRSSSAMDFIFPPLIQIERWNFTNCWIYPGICFSQIFPLKPLARNPPGENSEFRRHLTDKLIATARGSRGIASEHDHAGIF